MMKLIQSVAIALLLLLFFQSCSNDQADLGPVEAIEEIDKVEIPGLIELTEVILEEGKKDPNLLFPMYLGQLQFIRKKEISTVDIEQFIDRYQSISTEDIIKDLDGILSDEILYDLIDLQIKQANLSSIEQKIELINDIIDNGKSEDQFIKTIENFRNTLISLNNTNEITSRDCFQNCIFASGYLYNYYKWWYINFFCAGCYPYFNCILCEYSANTYANQVINNLCFSVCEEQEPPSIWDIDHSKGGWYLGDFNGDNDIDLAAYRANLPGTEVIINSGNFGTNGPIQSYFESDGIWTSATLNFSKGGWYIGDFNGDGKDDVLRVISTGTNVVLSNGNAFSSNGIWSPITPNFDHGGWHVGDFNGDGKDDIFRYRTGISGAEVYLSTGSSFAYSGSWTGHGVNFSKGGWSIGDFNGDGKDDIFRNRLSGNGIEVFFSNGSNKFNNAGVWTYYSPNYSHGGWHVGDFNGDGKDDIFRYLSGTSGAQVFLSSGNNFVLNGSWTGAGVNFAMGGWYIGDFNGDGKDDIFRHRYQGEHPDVLLSTGTSFGNPLSL